MSAKGLGAMLVFLGIGSIVLPFFGLQFKIMALFGGASLIISIVATILGGIMIAAGEV